MSFRLRNPRNPQDVTETPSKDRCDFLVLRGWELIEVDGKPVIETIELPPVHIEDVLDEQEYEQELEDRRKGKNR